MHSTQPNDRPGNAALWITVIVEALMIVAVAAYNIYEIRRSSRLLQDKIEGLSEFSARQGEKLDRMMTALELYAGRKFATNDLASTNALREQRIEKAIEFLHVLKSSQNSGNGQGAENASELRNSERSDPDSVSQP